MSTYYAKFSLGKRECLKHYVLKAQAAISGFTMLCSLMLMLSQS